MSTLTYPAPSVAAPAVTNRPLRRPRQSVWPYAGVVAAASGATSLFFLSQGNDQFAQDSVPSTKFVLDNLHGATWIKFGGAMGLLSVVAGMVFLIGLTNFFQRLRPDRTTVTAAMRIATAAFVASATVGALMRYIVAGGAEGGIDKNLYTHEAVSTLSSLADQLTCASYLPALIATGLAGWVGFKDRLLARPVGIGLMLLTGGSLSATLVLGLPYSSIIDFPLMTMLIAVNAMFSRKAV